MCSVAHTSLTIADKQPNGFRGHRKNPSVPKRGNTLNPFLGVSAGKPPRFGLLWYRPFCKTHLYTELTAADSEPDVLAATQT